MTEIILCNRTLSGNAFKNGCGVDIKQLSSIGCANPNMIGANTPYLLKGGNPTLGATTLAKLSNSSITKNLTNLSLSYGSDNLIALSEITAKLQEYNVGLMGASTSVYANRMGGFVGAVQNYQSALMEYRQKSITKSPLQVQAKQNAKIAFDKMHSSFGHEVKAATSQIKSRRGIPMTNFKRGTDIARSSRSIAKLDLVNPVQADNIVKFAKHAKFLGNGLAVIDFGSRVGSIHNNYKAGGNWEREMFIESSSFAASAITGTLVVEAGLAILFFATPVGWMGLVVGGLAVAGTAAVASIGVNDYAKKNSGSLYDDIMKWINL